MYIYAQLLQIACFVLGLLCGAGVVRSVPCPLLQQAVPFHQPFLQQHPSATGASLQEQGQLAAAMQACSSTSALEVMVAGMLTRQPQVTVCTLVGIPNHIPLLEPGP
eukprot:1160399-Pelagomonas_calceolata.AAC.1